MFLKNLEESVQNSIQLFSLVRASREGSIDRNWFGPIAGEQTDNISVFGMDYYYFDFCAGCAFPGLLSRPRFNSKFLQFVKPKVKLED